MKGRLQTLLVRSFWLAVIDAGVMVEVGITMKMADE